MFEIIPAIDILNGKCVRLKQGRYDEETKYSDDPLEIAKGHYAKGEISKQEYEEIRKNLF